MLFCNGRIKAFRYRIHNFDIIYGHDDRLPKVMITFYMGGNADLMNDIGYNNFKIGGIFSGGNCGAPSGAEAEAAYAFREHGIIHGLYETIGNSAGKELFFKNGAFGRNKGEKKRKIIKLFLCGAKYADYIHLRHERICEHDIRAFEHDAVEKLAPVFANYRNFKTEGGESFLAGSTKLGIIVRNHYFQFIFHGKPFLRTFYLIFDMFISGI